MLAVRVFRVLRGLLRERGCNHVGVACERDAHGVDGVAGEGFKRRGDLVLQLRAQLSQLGVSTRIDLRVDAHARVVLVRDVNLDVVRGQAVMALDDVLDRGLDGVLRDGDAAVVALKLQLRVLARSSDGANQHDQQAQRRDA